MASLGLTCAPRGEAGSMDVPGLELCDEMLATHCSGATFLDLRKECWEKTWVAQLWKSWEDLGDGLGWMSTGRCQITYVRLVSLYRSFWICLWKGCWGDLRRNEKVGAGFAHVCVAPFLNGQSFQEDSIWFNGVSGGVVPMSI